MFNSLIEYVDSIRARDPAPRSRWEVLLYPGVLALGMHRMAAKKALVRTMSAIETLGTLTTIATDKTGTLTKNKLTVQETWQPQKDVNFYNYIASSLNDTLGTVHDPLDVALREFIQQ